MDEFFFKRPYLVVHIPSATRISPRFFAEKFKIFFVSLSQQSLYGIFHRIFRCASFPLLCTDSTLANSNISRCSVPLPAENSPDTNFLSSKFNEIQSFPFSPFARLLRTHIRSLLLFELLSSFSPTPLLFAVLQLSFAVNCS